MSEFTTTLFVKPRAWKRAEGKHHRYMPKTQREYYYTLYAELASSGIRPLEAGAEYGITLSFYRKDRRYLDSDNLLKAFLDAGQPSNWVRKSDVGYVDLWDDKAFSETHTYRYRGAEQDKIEVKIWRRSTTPA